MRRENRLIVILVSAVCLLLNGAGLSWAGDGDGGGAFGGATQDDGAMLRADLNTIALLAAGKNLDGSIVTTPYEYSTRLACQNAGVGQDPASACYKASQGCLGICQGG